MKRWVVTGPIGGGKSTVTRLLAQRGALVVDGDRLGHEVLADPQVVAEIVREFGPAAAPEGQVDRAVLGPIVFADPAAMERLNTLTHGRISALAGRRLDELAAAGNHELAVLEAAVYFLFPSPPVVDLVIAVVADSSLRFERLTASRGLTSRQAMARMAAQSGLDGMWEQADVVLANNGNPEDLQREVDQLMEKYLQA